MLKLMFTTAMLLYALGGLAYADGGFHGPMHGGGGWHGPMAPVGPHEWHGDHGWHGGGWHPGPWYRPDWDGPRCRMWLPVIGCTSWY